MRTNQFNPMQWNARNIFPFNKKALVSENYALLFLPICRCFRNEERESKASGLYSHALIYYFVLSLSLLLYRTSLWNTFFLLNQCIPHTHRMHKMTAFSPTLRLSDTSIPCQFHCLIICSANDANLWPELIEPFIIIYSISSNLSLSLTLSISFRILWSHFAIKWWWLIFLSLFAN